MRDRRVYETTKVVADRLVGVVLLLALSPTIGVVGLIVRARLGRPVFFCQERPGKSARPFTLVKFRTMREPLPGEPRLASDGRRLTSVGRWLRETSLDELPTLVNVVRGELSLVGPRPLLNDYLDRYTPEQARRHEVRPGVTGLAQISGRNAISWEERLALDVYYVDHRSVWLDLRILMRTVRQVALRKGVNRAGSATMPEFTGNSRTAAAA